MKRDRGPFLGGVREPLSFYEAMDDLKFALRELWSEIVKSWRHSHEEEN